mmetsp:Transcript_23184/g.35569  ORF Transcript_23184/g.35569 Transcript_23184/m.35569 type:complete len:211 (+) Transcript_23184:95-727(+)
MVKHNNVIPNIHCHKKYLQSSRGPLKVKLALNQATRKKTRRLKRAAKAAKIAPRPLQMLRPLVQSPTQRYNSKQRLGRGFTLEELQAVGLTAAYARTVGIAVDTRRINRSQESLDLNAARLQQYLDRLIVFPKTKAEHEAANKEDLEAVEGAPAFKGVVMPIVKEKAEIEMMDVTDELKNFKAYHTMRVVRQETKIEGHQISAASKKKKD